MKWYRLLANATIRKCIIILMAIICPRRDRFHQAADKRPVKQKIGWRAEGHELKKARCPLNDVDYLASHLVV